MFDPFNSLFFYLGLLLVSRPLLIPKNLYKGAGTIKISPFPAVVILIWLFLLLLPDFITDDSPHFLRSIGALPIVYLVWAVGLMAALRLITDRLGKGHSHVQSATIAVILLAITAHTSYDYFVRWANAAEARLIYGADIAEIAQHVQNEYNGSQLFVVSGEYYRDLEPFRYRLHWANHPPYTVWFDGRTSLAFPPAESGLDPIYLFGESTPPAEAWLPLLNLEPEKSGRAYQRYRMADDAVAQVEDLLTPTSVIINNELRVLGYQRQGDAVSGRQIELLIGWQALKQMPPGTDYTLLARLVDAQGYVWAQADKLAYEPANWQPGVIGLQRLRLRFPGDLPVRAYQLTVELVNRQTGQALPTEHGQSAVVLEELMGQVATSPRELDAQRLPNASVQRTALGLTLRGYQADQRHLTAETSLGLTLYWQVAQQPAMAGALQFYLTHADRPDGEPIYRWPPITPINGEWPTHAWPTHHWVRDHLRLPFDPALPSGQFNLRGRWVDEQTVPLEPRAQTINLGQITVSNTP